MINMASSCPLINSKEWKMLVNQVGDNLAWRIWETYDGYPPTLKSISDLKRELSIKDTPFSNTLPAIYKRIREYNAKHNTSHSIVDERIGESQQVRVRIIPNYLPVNHIKQLERDNARKDDGRLKNTIKGLKQLDLFNDTEYKVFNTNTELTESDILKLNSIGISLEEFKKLPIEEQKKIKECYL